MFIVLDTETGGFEAEEVDVLTIGILIVSDDLETIHHRSEHRISRDVYRVTAGALAVNGIDLVAHHERAVPLSVLKELIEEDILFFNSQEEGANPFHRFGLMGFNLKFDIPFVQQILPDFMDKWIDPKQIIDVMHHAPRGGLQRCAERYGLTVEGGAHTALADAELTLLLYKRLRRTQ